MSAVTAISQISAVTQTTTTSEQDALQPAEQDNLPTPSKSALSFLQDIEADDFKHLLFSDSLCIVSDTGKELGDFCVSVEHAVYGPEQQQCFLVHANSHGAIDSVPCGTSITAWVDHNLSTLKQEHHEYVKLENHPLDRKTYISQEQGEYVVNRVISQGEEVTRTAQTFSADKLQGFISEGSNLLLQRLLIKKGFPEDLQLLAFDSESNMCPCTYRKLAPRTQIVEETEMDVEGIERTINSISDLPTTWQVYFNSDGHLTSRVQVGSPVTMRLLALPKHSEEEEDVEKPTFGKKPLNWEEDMQLYSAFLDRKDELKGEHAVYMRHHPELKSLLADFMQFLLLRKPDDVIAFCADYFSSFSTKMPNPTPYKQSNSPNTFINSQATAKIKHLSQIR